MSALKYTPVDQIPGIVAAARAAFDADKTRPLEWRKRQIRQIKNMMAENTAAIVEALKADLRRPEMEGVMAEVATVVAEAQEALDNIDDWVKPESVTTPAALAPGSSYIQRDPLGVVLIISPWNFPIQLCLNPAVAALAAGNSVVIKPSEVAPSSAALLETLVARYMDTDAVKVVQGAVAETQAVLAQRFDHICYTGNAEVAKHVMAAASKFLTPVTLELGGKSPAIVDRTANLDLAAKRILWGKCLNDGQVCIAPDYILVEKEVEQALLDKLSSTMKEFYGPDPKSSPHLGRIVNGRHFDRVANLLKTAGGQVVYGGDIDKDEKWIAPTIIRDPKPDAPIMREEIFGPLLPVKAVANVEEAIKYVRAGEKPLALYHFTTSSKLNRQVLSQTTSGGAVTNDVVMHNANPHLPFGGVGTSGIGAYHGRWGFNTFSHAKGVFHQANWIDTGRLRYAPYTPGKAKLISWIVMNPPSSPRWLKWFGIKDVIIVGLLAAVGVLWAKSEGRL